MKNIADSDLAGALETLFRESPAAEALAKRLFAEIEASQRLLAESQAREAQLREALGDIANFSHKAYEVLRWANAALALPQDDSALQAVAHRAGITALREAATLCDGIENCYLEDDGTIPNTTDVAVGAGVCATEIKKLADAREAETQPDAETS